MACGTGKTFTALRIAEAVAKEGGRVLYLVPSISLFQQSMREWATQQAISHRYIGICSDTRAGRTDEDASLQELELPVTTDPQKILTRTEVGGALRPCPPDQNKRLYMTATPRLYTEAAKTKRPITRSRSSRWTTRLLMDRSSTGSPSPRRSSGICSLITRW